MDIDSDSDVFLSASSGDESSFSSPSLASTLLSYFCDVPKNFNVIHINAQSIPAHYHDMLANLDGNNIDAILVSESWLKPCLPSVSYSLPGFTLIRNDRSDRVGGGVAIYLRSHIPYSVINMSAQPPPQNAGEHLFLEVELHHSKLLLGVYYSPSSSINYFSSFENLLVNLASAYSQSIIMGDFNTCLLKNDSRTMSFQSIVNSCNLNILPLNATHHFPNSTPSLLDLIIVSTPSRVAKHGQCSADAFSYHHLIFLSYKMRPPKAKSKIIQQRNFGGMDICELQKDAENICWDSFYDSTSVDDKASILTSKIIELYDVHAPLRPIKLKHLPAPWLTENIKLIMEEKAKAKCRFKTRPTAANLEKYVSARNRCNKVCRNAQRQHIHSSVENGDPAKVWKFLRSLGVGKPRLDTLPKSLNLDLLNQHFSSTSACTPASKQRTLNYLSMVPTPDYSPFALQQLSDCDVKSAILVITSKALGSDCVSRNMIVPIIDQILPIITNLLNFSLSSGSFPSSWKEALITPLPKTANPVSMSEYRPISILPFLSKVLERLVHSQLSNFLTSHHLLNPLQSGFRPGHSTVSALIKVTDDIRLGMENSQLTLLSLLDFSNAFGTVDFDILLGVLGSLNISPTAIAWFRSYLFGRRQRIRVEDSLSSWCDTTAGVPQGGVLSPLLFAVFINTISCKLVSSYHLYADDLQIYRSTPLSRLNETIEVLNMDLKHICEWSQEYGLRVNPTKTQVIIVGSPRFIARIDWSQLTPVIFDGSILPYKDRVKDLGIIIDRNLSWNPQIQDISRKLFASIGSLRRLRNFLPTATKIALAQSLLLPILDYADASYLDLTEEQLDKLERLQNVCIRFIFGLRKYDHVSEFRTKLKWLPIRLRRNTHILSLLYSILFNPTAPSYLKDRFKLLHESHSFSLRSSQNLKLHCPTHTTDFFGKSFTVQAVRLWNALPEYLMRTESLQIFKKQLRQHYLAISAVN